MIPLSQLLILLLKIKKNLFRALIFHFSNSESLFELMLIIDEKWNFIFLIDNLFSGIMYFILINENILLRKIDFIKKQFFLIF